MSVSDHFLSLFDFYVVKVSHYPTYVHVFGSAWPSASFDVSNMNFLGRRKLGHESSKRGGREPSAPCPPTLRLSIWQSTERLLLKQSRSIFIDNFFDADLHHQFLLFYISTAYFQILHQTSPHLGVTKLSLCYYQALQVKNAFFFQFSSTIFHGKVGNPEDQIVMAQFIMLAARVSWTNISFLGKVFVDAYTLHYTALF